MKDEIKCTVHRHPFADVVTAKNYLLFHSFILSFLHVIISSFLHSTMAITYKVVECVNPSGAIGVDYACDRAVKTGDYSFKELAEEIQFSTTVTKADVVAVLTAAKEYIKKGLLAGQRVVLDELGALRVSLKSKCFAQSEIAAEDFNPASYIQGIRVSFRPEADLIKNLRANYSVKRVSSDLMA
jgi:predicted histone-like DNA-binding protein